MATSNINFNFNKKKKFTIDGDENKVIELDTSDVGIVTRLNDSMTKINELEKKQERLTELSSQNDDTAALDFTQLFSEVEREMRDIIDYIFDSSVADTILGKSSVFSPVNGKYKFEQIIDVLLGLYETDIKKETSKINTEHINKHTAKYVK